MLLRVFILCFVILNARIVACAEPSDEGVFQERILPTLHTYCGDCHDGDADNQAFMTATALHDVTTARGVWRNVAMQLTNRTMPPIDEAQLAEADRIFISTWIRDTLRKTACDGEAYAGTVTTRRLNRREYANTIRDLVGVELDLATTLPADSGGGEGFDNNGETLFLTPLLLERYLETAQQVVDAAIIPGPMKVMFLPPDMQLEFSPGVTPARSVTKTTNGEMALTIPAGERASILIPIPVAGDFKIPVGIVPRDEGDLNVGVEVDDIAAAEMTYRRYGEHGQANQESVQLRLTRGLHKISIRAPQQHPVQIVRLRVVRIPAPTTPAQVARHIKLLGVKPRYVPPQPAAAARRTVREFAGRAFRRPVADDEVQRLMVLYQQADERGDSYEECVKLAMKSILVSPEFLFRMERPPTTNAIEPLSHFELATRLSYFFWSSMPDDELRVLARLGQLQDAAILDQQIDRMLDDPRSHEFFTQFIGQWLGTQDLGTRRAATENAIQDIYTPFIAADMREQAVLLFEHILREDRSVLELLDADYTFLSRPLARFYGITDVPPLPSTGFRKVALRGEAAGRYGGLLGLGGVLALNSHISQRETSPVLRGAWVLDTLLGTRVPAPPDDVPALNTDQRDQNQLTLRETLERHRADEACAACHRLMDPIGFGLENFDFLGRWRDTDQGQPIDSVGTMPSGETFHGPGELKQVLLQQKDAFARQLIRKLLGYALGRSLVDEDECTIEELMNVLEQHEYRGKALLQAIVRSTPFRHQSHPASNSEPSP